MSKYKINLLKVSLLMALTISFVLLLVACGSTDNNTTELDRQAVLEAKEQLSIGYIGTDSEDAVLYDLSLVETTILGVSVSWESTNLNVISTNGNVTRPGVDTSVTLTATLTKGDASDTKIFEVLVIGTAESDLENAVNALKIIFATGEKSDQVRSNLTLVEELDGDILVSWTSSNEDVIDSQGLVTRHETENIVVTLTATLSKGAFVETKEFVITVLSLEADILYRNVVFVNSTLDSVRVVDGELIEEPIDPSIEGKTFLGWYKEPTFKTLFDFSEPITQNTQIYGHYLNAVETTIPNIISIGQGVEHGTVTTNWYIVVGKIKSISNAEYGNMTITDGENDLPIYGVWSLGGTKKFSELEEKPHIGDIVYLYGPIKRFNESIELNNSQLIKFNEDENTPPFDINDYDPVDISEARTRPNNDKVLITGVVAQINYSNGFNPAGVWIVDDSGSIYVYDLMVAASVVVGDEVVVTGVRANFILADETYWADRLGYEGAIQLTQARLIEKTNSGLNFNTDWIEKTTIKNIMETDYKLDNITGSIHKVTAFINKVPGSGFTNYYFNDLDNKTGSYVYTMNNGNDYSWLDQYDGQLREVYLSVINGRSNAAGVLYRFVPIAVGDEVSYDNSYNAEYAVVYEGMGQLDNVYYEGYSPDLEVKTAVNNSKLGIENVVLTYQSSNEDVAYFETVNEKLIFKTGIIGSTLITISSTDGDNTYSETFEVTVSDVSDLVTQTVLEGIESAEEEYVTLRGIVGASLVNQSGFFLIDETGMVAVRMPSVELSKLSLGNEVVIKGIKKHVRGSVDPALAVGQLVIDESIVYMNLQGNHQYPTNSFLGQKTLAYLGGLDRAEEHSTSVYTVVATINHVVTPYFSNYNLGEAGQTYNVYSSSASQLSFLDPYRGQTLEMEVTVVNWNGQRYQIAILSIIVDGVKIPSNQNFR